MINPLVLYLGTDCQLKAAAPVQQVCISKQLAPIQVQVAPVPVQPAKKQVPRVPDYLSANWAKKFIPSITHALFVSLGPFKDYKMSSPVFIVTLQEVFSVVYPDINHKITPSDVIAVTVCAYSILVSCGPSCSC